RETGGAADRSHRASVGHRPDRGQPGGDRGHHASMSAPTRAAPPPLSPWSDPTPERSPRAELASYADALRRRPRLVVGLPLVFAIVAVGIAIPRPRFFLARAAFVASEPQSMSGSLGALSSIAGQLGVPALSSLASTT